MTETRKHWWKPLALTGFVATLATTLVGCATAPMDSASLTPDSKPLSKPLVQGKEYMIMANRPHQIHVVEMENDTLYKSCDMPGDFGPGTLIMAPDNHTAYMLTNHYKHIYGVDLDTCELTFHAAMSQAPNERAISMMSLALSPDGSELYSLQNPTILNRDHYRVQDTRLSVYKTADGMNAQPVRTFDAPRQVTVMATANDGSLYMAGADIYKMDVHTGKVETAIPARNWQRPLYAPPDVLAVWPIQSPRNDFTILYVTAKFQDETYDMNTAEWIYGYFNVDLDTGETTTTDFAEFTEIFFTGMRSPNDGNLMYGVLNNLAKYDIKEKKLLKTSALDHSYYCLAFSQDGKKIYAGGTFNDLAIFDADSLELIGKLELPGGDTAPTTLQAFVR